MILTLAYLLVPAIIVIACQKFSWLDKAGVVVLSFGLGIAIAAGLDLTLLFNADTITAVQKDVSEITIAIALPLLLFSINVKNALNMAGDTMKGMALALLSVIMISIIGAIIFADQVADVWQVAGMSVGAYTGGGPNMAAIKTAIDAKESIFVTMVTYDILFSAIYLLFVMTLGQRLFGLFLRKYEPKNEAGEIDYAGMEHLSDETANGYKKLTQVKLLPQTVAALLSSGVVVGLALFIASLVPETYKSTTTIIGITSLGLMASFIPRVRNLANSFQLGMYLILVFCFTMGTMTDTHIFTNIDLSLASYISFILLGSLVMQALLCKLFNIDTDTFLITSSAAIMSVPFIPVIAGALKNREILLPGFAVAIIGYAIGNYLGIIVANVSRALVGA
ncbi:MAG: DUF819 family protein [Oleispira antarctica]|nr:DUF819 family protein [Oleispira antarctica]MBQ0793245.1 DUF819 family protein [Oleispira antarctica]